MDHSLGGSAPWATAAAIVSEWAASIIQWPMHRIKSKTPNIKRTIPPRPQQGGKNINRRIWGRLGVCHPSALWVCHPLAVPAS